MPARRNRSASFRSASIPRLHPLRGRASAGDGFRVRRSTLPNGLQLVAVEMPHVHSVSLVAYVRAGSRYETPATNGVSHFLEHMFFRGTRRYPSTYDLAHQIESLGAVFNATTTRDMAYYFTEVAPRHLEHVHAVEIEREVVLEEMS